MNTEKKLIPLLRFPEFKKDGMWGEKCFGDCLDYEQPQQYLVSSDNYKKEGTPVLTAGKTFVLGFTDESYGIYRQLPVIIFDDFTTASRYVNFPFKAKSSAMKMLQNKDGYDLKFMFEALQNYKYEPKEHQRHWISIFQNFKTLVPSYSEQRKIAECLFSIDSYIYTVNEKVEQLKAHKKSLLQKLFPQNGKNVPDYRFPEFEKDGMWGEKCFGDCLDYEQPQQYLVSSDNYKKEGTPVLTAGKTFVLGFTDESYGIYRQLPVIIFDDFTTASRYVNFPFKAKSSAMKMLQNKDGYDLKFMFEALQNYKYEPKEHQRHWISIFQNFKTLVPSYSEQRKIAECLFSIDKIIEYYSEKASQLVQHKKGIMQQLFPINR